MLRMFTYEHDFPLDPSA